MQVFAQVLAILRLIGRQLDRFAIVLDGRLSGAAGAQQIGYAGDGHRIVAAFFEHAPPDFAGFVARASSLRLASPNTNSPQRTI